MSKVQSKTSNKSVFKVVPEKVREQAKKMYETSNFFDQTNNKEVDLTSDRLLSKKDVDDLEKIINVIYPHSVYGPSQLQESNDDLLSLGTVVRYFPRDHKQSKAQLLLAYVLKEYRNSYRIFINEDCEDESFDSMDLHEKGHILFNHTQNIKGNFEQFKKELEIIWDLKLAKYFDNKTFKNNKDKIVSMLYREFSNIAQDMEINSKLFDNGEWIKAKKTMARSGIIVHLKALQREFDDLSGLIKNQNAKNFNSPAYKKILENFVMLQSNIKQRIAGEEGDFQFCYPENKGWPNKLDWMTYMILLVKDIDDTMEQIMKNLGIPCGDKGDGGKPCDDGSGGNSPGGKQISQDVLDKYFDDAQKESNAMEDANSDALGDEGDNEDLVNPAGESIGNQRSEGGTGRGKGSGAVKVEFETCDTFDNFTKFLRKECLGKKNRKWNSDVLYNSNRGKFASQVVVPRRHLTERWMPTECHIVVDVSGSVPTNYVERVINSIVDTNSGIDLKNSHIIFCDTQVVSDEIMSKRTKSVYAGGGTQIANGIKYVGKKGYCKKATDKLFIISDFEDNLHAWVEAAKEFPGIKYAIGYNVHSQKECEELFRSNSNDNKFKQDWNRTFRTIFITEEIED